MKLVDWLSTTKNKVNCAILVGFVLAAGTGWIIYNYWEWFLKPENQATIKFFGGGLVLAIGAGWTLYTYFKSREPMISRETINKEVKKIVKDCFKEDATIGQGSAACMIAERQLANPEETYRQKVAIIEDVIKALDKLGGLIPSNKVSDAKKELERGNTKKAKEIFAERAGAANAQGAEAAYYLGRIAEYHFDFLEGYHRYSDATKLVPENLLYLDNTGRLASVLGLYTDAKLFCQRALQLRLQTQATGVVEVADNLQHLAVIHEHLHDYEDAENCYKEALRHLQYHGNPEKLAAIRNSLGRFYESTKNIKKAEALYLETLGELYTCSLDDPGSIVQTLNNLAILYDKKKEFNRAHERLLHAITYKEKLLENKHAEIAANVYSILGRMYERQGAYASAGENLKESLKIRSKYLGKDNPAVATSHESLARLYMKNREFKKAEEHAMQAIDSRKRLYGEEHLDIAKALHTLGRIYENRAAHLQGKDKRESLQEAYRVHSEACELKKRLGLQKTAKDTQTLDMLKQKMKEEVAT